MASSCTASLAEAAALSRRAVGLGRGVNSGEGSFGGPSGGPSREPREVGSGGPPKFHSNNWRSGAGIGQIVALRWRGVAEALVLLVLHWCCTGSVVALSPSRASSISAVPLQLSVAPAPWRVPEHCTRCTSTVAVQYQ